MEQCSMCEKVYTSEVAAINCEAEHEKNKDRYWENHLHKLSMIKLKQAASLPGQKRLQ